MVKSPFIIEFFGNFTNTQFEIDLLKCHDKIFEKYKNCTRIEHIEKEIKRDIVMNKGYKCYYEIIQIKLVVHDMERNFENTIAFLHKHLSIDKNYYRLEVELKI